MSLSDIASIGSLISGVAVLISLIYLGLQVRQSDRNQRALINQGSIGRTVDFLIWHGSAEIAGIVERVRIGATEFTATELVQLRILFRIFLLDLQDHLVQHRAGLTDEITFSHVLAASRIWMGSPLFRVMWKHDGAYFAPELAIFVDQHIKTNPPLAPSDPTAQILAELVQMQRELRH